MYGCTFSLVYRCDEILHFLLPLQSVPDDLVHGFQPVTNKRDVAISIIWKTEIDIYSLSHFTALLYPEQQGVKHIGRPDQNCQLCYKQCD